MTTQPRPRSRAFKPVAGLKSRASSMRKRCKRWGLTVRRRLRPRRANRPQRVPNHGESYDEQDKEFLKELNSAQPTQPTQTDGQALQADLLEQIRDFIAGFVVVGIDENVEAELQFYAPKANYYDSGVVTRDFIRRDIRRYNQKWPTRRYWLVGDIRVLNDPQADPLEVQYRIKYAVKNQEQERTGTAVKTVKLQKTSSGFEITSVRERTLN